MDNEEFIQRFLRLEGKDSRQDPTSNLILSSDRVMGIAKDFNEARFMSFGRFKLKGKHLKKERIAFTEDLGLNPILLYRAMYVLLRRKKFELGLYSLFEHSEVFAIREGNNVVLIAPASYESSTVCTPFDEFVVRVNKALFRRWKTWSRILNGRRAKA